jgi:hypothetical protein
VLVVPVVLQAFGDLLGSENDLTTALTSPLPLSALLGLAPYKTNQPIDTIESSELRHDHWDG